MKHRTGWAPDDQGDEEDTVSMEAGEQPNFVDMATLLLTDGRAYAETEAERFKLRASLVGAAIRNAVVLVAIALFLTFGALVALMIGAIWALAPYLGPALSTLTVVGTAFCAIVILLAVARTRFKRTMNRVFHREGEIS